MAEVLVLSVSKVIREQPKFLASDGVVQQATADAAPSVTGMDNHVFQPRRATALGGADGEEQTHHAHDAATLPRTINAAHAGLLDDKAQGPFLPPAVGLEVGFLREQYGQQFTQLRHVARGGFRNGGLARLASLAAA